MWGVEGWELAFEELVSKVTDKLLPLMASSALTSLIFPTYSPEGKMDPCSWVHRTAPRVCTQRGVTVAPAANTAPFLVSCELFPDRKALLEGAFLSGINVLTVAQPDFKGSLQNYPGT